MISSGFLKEIIYLGFILTLCVLNSKYFLNPRIERKKQKKLLFCTKLLVANQFIATHGQVTNLFNTNRYKNNSADRKSYLSEKLLAYRIIFSIQCK